MTRNHTGDVVGDYLNDVEKLLDRLPSAQRRELLTDLETHIVTERAERNAESEAELRQILERLGSPDVVAAAAYEQAPETTAAAPASRRKLYITAIVVIVVLVLLVLVTIFYSRGSSDSVVIRPAQVGTGITAPGN
jgi:uncharacterized membrane protein